jgi:hypothetical protein
MSSAIAFAIKYYSFRAQGSDRVSCDNRTAIRIRCSTKRVPVNLHAYRPVAQNVFHSEHRSDCCPDCKYTRCCEYDANTLVCASWLPSHDPSMRARHRASNWHVHACMFVYTLLIIYQYYVSIEGALVHGRADLRMPQNGCFLNRCAPDPYLVFWYSSVLVFYVCRRPRPCPWR